MNDPEVTPLKLNTREILEDDSKTVEKALKVINDTDEYVSEQFGVTGAERTKLTDEALVYGAEEATHAADQDGMRTNMEVADIIGQVETVIVEGALEGVGVKNTTGENPIMDLEKDGLNNEVTLAIKELLTEDAKLPSGESIVGVAVEVINASEKDSIEALTSAIKQFVEQFQDVSVKQKQVAVADLYSAIDAVYDAKYKGKSVPIIFSKSEGYAFNYDGVIRIPLDKLEKQTPNEAVFSIFHEYRHAMQPSLGILSSSSGLSSFLKLKHDMFPEEIDATKFAFENMDRFGIDKTKIGSYKEWSKAIRVVETIELVKQNYNPEIANKILNIYELLDEYATQTNRSYDALDGIKGQFYKIQYKVRFRSNITSARSKLIEFEKVAKTSDDKFLLKVVSDIRTDWPQYL